MLLTAAVRLLALSAIAHASLGAPTRYVHVGELPSWPVKLSALVCSGLLNRAPQTPVYTFLGGLTPSDVDVAWLVSIDNISTVPPLTNYSELMEACLAGPAGGRYISYNASSQQAIIPAIVTLAGVLDAVPLDVASGALPSGANQKVFDALAVFAGFSPLEATQFLYEHHINQTTGMSKSNPGYESQSGKKVLHPKLTGPPDIGLTDYIVKQRLFNLYLTEGCVPLTKEHSLMRQIVTNNPWPKPIGVMGYDNTVVVAGGDFFEAETLCVPEVPLGQIASSGVNNLAYFSRKPKITSPLPVHHPAPVPFNASKTYISFLVGDGDNVAYIKGTRRSWMQQRVSICQNATTAAQYCKFPLLWTMSPHVLHLAPDWAVWYSQQLLKTQADGFALPPSGDLYSYPSMFPDNDQKKFVENTEQDAILLSTSVSTVWEWALHWGQAIKNYFPKFGAHAIVTSLVAVNVPYNIPTPAFGSKQYKVVGDNAVLFRPHEWRGTRGGGKIPWANRENLSVEAMAAELNGYPPGSVVPIYITSDGGANLEDIYALVDQLDEHVTIVGTETGALALEASKQKL